VGAGSLCSGRPEDPSPVLEQIGFPGTTGFRVSLGQDVSAGHLEELLGVLSETVRELQRMETVSSETLARYGPRGDA
jgi:cysteine sulfinate desulfinase/cysteine desulfurase-like protein